MANHQRDAAGNDGDDGADVQDGDKSVVVTIHSLRVNVQHMAAVECRHGQENHRDATPEYGAPRNTPPASRTRGLLLR